MMVAVAEGRIVAVRRRRPVPRAGKLVGWVFVGPAVLLILGLTIFPAAWSLVLSFQDWNGFSDPEFVGAANYSRMFSDSELWAALLHTGLYVVLFVPASMALGICLATALNRRIRFIGIYRTAIFVPFVLSAATTGVLANYLFDPQFGLVNNVLRVVGLPAQGWLSDPSQAMIVITVMALWGSAAFTTVVYLAALQDIPQELVEAATIDGASRWQTFRNVIWPQLAPVSIFLAVWQAIQAVQLFDLVYTTTRGGPLSSTRTVVYHLWETAFHGLEFGYGSAIAYAVFGITLLLTLAVAVRGRRRHPEAMS